jgi:NADPH:quinone reductase-like Zn-dependent oxidoreductase
MKAVLLTKTGKPSVLQIQDIPIPEPKAGEVRVKIEMIGINYAEILSRKGLYGWAPKKPYVPGMEAFGQIDKVGEEVQGREIDQKVVIGTQFGCYAEYVVVKEQKVLPAIPRFSPEENAAFTVNFMTAWVSLFEMARMRPTDSVLINIAAGGVGSAAVQLAKKYGCTVYGTVGSDEKIDLVNGLQIDKAINYRKVDFEEKIKKSPTV